MWLAPLSCWARQKGTSGQRCGDGVLRLETALAAVIADPRAHVERRDPGEADHKTQLTQLDRRHPETSASIAFYAQAGITPAVGGR